MFESSFKPSLCILKSFNAFQVLKLFSFFLGLTCVIFARAINTDVWRAIVPRAAESQKNCSKPP